MEYHSATEKNEMMSFAATWMVLEIVILSEGSKNDKEQYRVVTYKQNLKEMLQMNLLMKQKQTHRLRKRTYDYKWERIVKEFGMDTSILLYFKWIIDRDLLYNTWNSVQYYVTI